MKSLFLLGMGAALFFTACATERPNTLPQFGPDNTITLGPGQSVILARGQTAKVPAGSMAVQPGPGNNQADIGGHKNTVVFESSVVIVSVSTTASGPADNLIIAK